MTPRTELLILVIGCALIAAAGLIACHLWGVQSMDPCAVDAPMEQAQCRAERGMRE